MEDSFEFYEKVVIKKDGYSKTKITRYRNGTNNNKSLFGYVKYLFDLVVIFFTTKS